TARDWCAASRSAVKSSGGLLSRARGFIFASSAIDYLHAALEQIFSRRVSERIGFLSNLRCEFAARSVLWIIEFPLALSAGFFHFVLEKQVVRRSVTFLYEALSSQ